jgi:hypothetical protein
VDRAAGDGRSEEVPWASVFDPEANARALTAIQHEGFRAASDLVDRFIRIASTGLSRTERPPSDEQPPTADGVAAMFGATAVEPMIRSWWSMADQFLGGDQAAGRSAEGHDATLDLTDVVADGKLVLDVAVSESATAEVWMVNRGRTDHGDVRLRCSDLLSDHGAVIQSSALAVVPSVAPMPGRSSRGVDVTIAVGPDVAPGIYRGTAMAERFPELWLPIAVTVWQPTP